VLLAAGANVSWANKVRVIRLACITHVHLTLTLSLSLFSFSHDDVATQLGDTAIMKAASNGQAETVKVLLAAGADGSHVNKVRSVGQAHWLV
jgi:ankyrin repeat protein